jgi:hypothetical protein
MPFIERFPNDLCKAILTANIRTEWAGWLSEMFDFDWGFGRVALATFG